MTEEELEELVLAAMNNAPWETGKGRHRAMAKVAIAVIAEVFDRGMLAQEEINKILRQHPEFAAVTQQEAVDKLGVL